MTDDNPALADLADTLGSALLAYADRVRPSRGAERDLSRLGLGRRQLEVMNLAGLDTQQGMSTREIADAIGGYNAANAHRALQSLHAHGLIENLPHGENAYWRLAPRYRSIDPYLAIAQLVAPGEWTTFDDISLVVHGDLRHGRDVVRTSIELADFPAHRVLPPGGQIPRAWRSYATKGPDPGECVRLLCGEDVPVDLDGRAARAHYISWDLLVERAADAGRLG